MLRAHYKARSNSNERSRVKYYRETETDITRGLGELGQRLAAK